ncbi:substrate-binding periplasmic protein [Pseudogemmobacter sonorensis]|uniref:substrate-binding periplasmic protein n=1 Tax=Pseudogemmobacter sonorensis TaxID=2989681 RepID=UPI00369E7ECE
MGCFASIAAAGVALVLASGGEERLVIATGPSFPPYLMMDEASGALSGYDYDLMQEVCARITAECDWQSVNFDRLIPGVAAGLFDVVLGGMAITAERRETVDFSRPYTWGGGVDWFVGRPGTPAPESVTTAAVSGTIQEQYLREFAYDHVSYPSEIEALAALGAGEVALALGPYDARPDLAPWIAGQGMVFLYSADVPDEGVGIAVCKGNHALLARIDAALDGMFADGTIAKLDRRWH